MAQHFPHSAAFSVRRAAAAALLVATLSAAPVCSGALADEARQPLRWREVWSGADVSSNVWLIYSGVTISPMGHIHEAGPRLRVAGGYGAYHYEDKRLSADVARWQGFDVETGFTDVLAGYLFRLDPLTVKAFAGLSVIGHDIAPADDETVVTGTEAGIKGAIELWLNIGDRGWASLDLSWSSAHDTRAARVRSGYRLLPTLSIGPEAAINVDSQGECRMGHFGDEGCRTSYLNAQDPKSLLDYSRTGAFLRYEWAGGEISASAGVLNNWYGVGPNPELAPYGTATWITQF